MCGGTTRQETGSQVKTNTWNAILAIGTKKELSDGGTMEWGAFAEHGSASFSLHGDTAYGNGSSTYTGGGLLAKWQDRKGFHAEASFRMGRLHDSASDILRDALGNSYGYNIRTNYTAGHLGIGKLYRFHGGKALDVYGKLLVTKRNGASFDAGGHYELGNVTSKLLRIGARYTGTGAKWNWYGGLALEHEFDGEANGTADGAEIRAASIKGTSLFAELGLRMEPTDTSPWSLDIGLTGHAGKHKGWGGNVTIGYLF
ncbi:MAG: autotransporter outer membrane beta-barrel domain-containing protein [Selenomonadaceae bacterium]|nr:autotransporter outer membrane beta-barrel domain-containing protein [Selenomonadaceae bacterium]